MGILERNVGTSAICYFSSMYVDLEVENLLIERKLFMTLDDSPQRTDDISKGRSFSVCMCKIAIVP